MIKRFALLFALLAPFPALAGELVIAGETLRLTGAIQPRDKAQFHSISGVLDGAFTIDVAATGGDPDAAMAIGRRILQQGYATRTDLQECRDICALIWLSGTPRKKADDTRVEISEDLTQKDDPARRTAIKTYLSELGLNDQQAAALFPETPAAHETTDSSGERNTDTTAEPETPYLAGYDGETLNGVPHGKGGWTLANGDRFTGTFQEGRPQGSGVLETVEGDRLRVFFNRGRPMGKTWLSGATGVQVEQRVSGRVLARRHEKAPWFSQSPVSSDGALKRPLPRQQSGQAIQLSDGSQYEGSLKEGKPDGFGRQMFPDGAIFTGMFEDGKKNGPGILVTAQGLQRAGLWRNGNFRDGSNAAREINVKMADNTPADTEIPPDTPMIPMGDLFSGMSREDVRRLQTRLNQLHYDAGVADGKIGRQTRTAVNAYAQDFELTRDERYPEDLIAWIGGEAEQTKPGWREIKGGECRVYSQIVHAVTDIDWSGVCLDGYASGRGILKITHRLNGKAVTYVYEGAVRRGRVTGPGADYWEGSHPAAGSRYKGTFDNGIREGAGTYTEPGLGRIEGSFEAGRPHGYAVQFDSDGKLLVSGEFRAGCLRSGNKRLAVLTTRQACGF